LGIVVLLFWASLMGVTGIMAGGSGAHRHGDAVAQCGGHIIPAGDRTDETIRIGPICW